jgi:hypothetical protein
MKSRNSFDVENLSPLLSQVENCNELHKFLFLLNMKSICKLLGHRNAPMKIHIHSFNLTCQLFELKYYSLVFNPRYALVAW